MSDSKPIDLSTLKPSLNATVVANRQGLEQVADFLGRVKEFGFDVETNITPTFFHRKLRTIQVGDRDEQYIIDLAQFCTPEELLQQGHKQSPAWSKDIVDTLKVGLESAEHLKLGVNLQFDYETVRWCLGLRPFNFYCCLLAEKVIYTGKIPFHAKDFWGMEDMVKRYCKLEINKDLQTSFDLTSPLTHEQVAYAALDTRFPFAIRAGQLPKIEKANLSHTVFQIEMPAIMPFGDMHLAGFGISKEKWREQTVRVEQKHKLNIADLDKHFVRVVGNRDAPNVDLPALEKIWKDERDKAIRLEHRKTYMAARKKLSTWKKDSEKWEGEAAINYGSSHQLLPALRQMGIKLDDTNDATLEEIEHPAIDALREYRTTKKLLDTYGEGFLVQYVDKDTGRVHSNISQLGADTGRTTSTGPNIQNIPHVQEYRSCFVAREGYVLITRDYDGCELRIIAELSGEESWIKAFNEGRDVHSMCAEIMYGDVWKNAAEADCAYYSKGKKCKCPGHKTLRDYIKQINFGIPYGMAAKKLARKLKITLDAAKELLALHAAKFPKVHACLNRLAELTKQIGESRTFAGRRRIIEGPTWEKAKEIAYKRLIEDGKLDRHPTQKQISRAYYGMWGSVEREGKNTPIQGGNADLTKVAMGLAWHRLEPEFGANFVNVVHDELVTESPKDTSEQASSFVGECMEKAGTFYVKKIPMTSGGCIADCWMKD